MRDWNNNFAPGGLSIYRPSEQFNRVGHFGMNFLIAYFPRKKQPRFVKTETPTNIYKIAAAHSCSHEKTSLPREGLYIVHIYYVYLANSTPLPIYHVTSIKNKRKREIKDTKKVLSRANLPDVLNFHTFGPRYSILYTFKVSPSRRQSIVVSSQTNFDYAKSYLTTRTLPFPPSLGKRHCRRKISASFPAAPAEPLTANYFA